MMDFVGTKDHTEREDEEAERLVRPMPKVKPPRRDRRRELVNVDRDSDIDRDPDTKGDPDMSMNRREVGGSANSHPRFFQEIATENRKARGYQETYRYSSYGNQVLQVGTPMLSDQSSRTAIYHGVQPYSSEHDGFAPYTGWQQVRIRDLGASDFSALLKSAKTWLSSPVLSEHIEGMVPDSRFRAALDLSIRSIDGGRYSSSINADMYNMLLAKLAGESQTGTLLTIREATINGEGTMIRIASEQANALLGRLDRVAALIEENSERWGISFKVAKGLVNTLDEVSDAFEKSAFGSGSLEKRQVEVLKNAKVLQQDTDEGYMGTYNSPMAPIQTDADEKYMSLFKDDQSEAVYEGDSTTGRPLAP